MEGVLAMGFGVLILFLILYGLDKVVRIGPSSRIHR
jgi:hypothetical protein